MKKLILVFILVVVSLANYAQTTNDVLELLIKNKTITQEQADSVRAESAIKQQDVDANKKSFFATASRQIQISGYTQVRYQFFQEPAKIDAFDIRRARFDVRGNVNSYFGYRLQVDFAGVPKVLDAYAEIKLTDYFNIIIGQAKIPFSYENLISSNKMESIDRSMVVEALSSRGQDVIGNQNGRDIGVQVGGGFLKYRNRNLFEYKIGIFNGSGLYVGDRNKDKDVIGRLVSHPIKGLDLGGSFYVGKGYFGLPTPTNQDRKRLGFELNYEYKRFFVRSEYIKGIDGPITRDGWYAETGYYVIPSKLQLLVKYDTFNLNVSAVQAGLTNYLIGGTYNFNNWSRIQAGFTIRQEDGPQISNNFAIVQYQIGF